MIVSFGFDNAFEDLQGLCVALKLRHCLCSFDAAHPPVCAPTLCLCKSRARRGLAARMLLVQSDSRCCRATDYRLCLNPSASGTRRRRQWAGRRDACTPSFAAAVWEIVQISRLRPDRESEVCLPSFLRPRRVSGASGCDDSPVSVTALTSAEISLPAEADGQRVSDRIAVLADTVDVVGLTDNHAGHATFATHQNGTPRK